MKLRTQYPNVRVIDGYVWRLSRVHVGSLTTSHSPDNRRANRGKDLDDAPPIMVRDGCVHDGHDRCAAAIREGRQYLPAYVRGERVRDRSRDASDRTR